MGVNVFIDGQAGTTGLRILDRFANRNDITLLQIDPEKRKDAAERKRLINSSDYTFLCLPDAAAREAVSLIENPDVRMHPLHIVSIQTGHMVFRNCPLHIGRKSGHRNGLLFRAAMQADLMHWFIRWCSMASLVQIIRYSVSQFPVTAAAAIR